MAIPQKKALSARSWLVRRVPAPAAVDRHTACLKKHPLLGAVDHPPVTVVVQQRLHRAGDVVNIDRAGQDDDIRSIQRLCNRPELVSVGAQLFRLGKALAAPPRRKRQNPGGGKTPSPLPQFVAKELCQMIGGALMALSMEHDNSHILLTSLLD